jgi:hypothetical protein
MSEYLLGRDDASGVISLVPYAKPPDSGGGDTSQIEADVAQLQTDVAALQDSVSGQTSVNTTQQSEIDQLQTDVDALQAGSGGGGGGGTAVVNQPDMIPFDGGTLPNNQQLTGTDNEKWVKVFDWWKSMNANTLRQSIGLPCYRQVTLNDLSIPTVSAARLKGGYGAAREYGTVCTVLSQGSKPCFKWYRNGQSYPSDGSPRDMYFEGIQWEGSTSRDFLPKLAMSNDWGAHTLWYCTFHNCGWKNWRTIQWGYGDGEIISGTTHLQGVADGYAPFFLGGSENSIFSAEISLGATYGAVNSAVPFIRSIMTLSDIGPIMTTNRKKGLSLSIEGGGDLTVTGWRADAQGSDPMYGSAVNVLAGDGILFQALSIHNAMANPGAAEGGAAANKAQVQVLGGTNIMFDGLRGHGNSPVLFVGPNVGQGQVQVGTVGQVDAGGAAPRLLYSKSGQIISPFVAASSATATKKDKDNDDWRPSDLFRRPGHDEDDD